jgi:16S rRNA (guanine1207-N2)-methyltransferase
MTHYFTNDKLDSKITTISSIINRNNYNFYVDNGVFSKGKVDYGTILLLETIKDIKGKVLDIGCGYGVIGIYLKSNYNCEIDMVDINLRALELTKMNSKKYKLSNINIFESDAYSNIDKKYDIIITNPPIRAGKQKVYEILLGAKEHLNKESKLYFVMRKDQGAKSTVEYLKNHYNVSILEKSNGFWIICAEN